MGQNYVNHRKICHKCGMKYLNIKEAVLLNHMNYKIIWKCRKCHSGYEEIRELDRKTPGYKTIQFPGQQSMGIHRWVWEQVHKEKLTSDVKIHHINWKKGDNRPENLLKIVGGQLEHSHQDSVQMMVAKIKLYEETLEYLKKKLNNTINTSTTTGTRPVA